MDAEDRERNIGERRSWKAKGEEGERKKEEGAINLEAEVFWCKSVN